MYVYTHASEGGMIRLETLVELKFQFELIELFELILLLKLETQFPVEEFAATVSQSTVPSPLLYIPLLSSSENVKSSKVPLCQTPVGLSTFSMFGRAAALIQIELMLASYNGDHTNHPHPHPEHLLRLVR